MCLSRACRLPRCSQIVRMLCEPGSASAQPAAPAAAAAGAAAARPATEPAAPHDDDKAAEVVSAVDKLAAAAPAAAAAAAAAPPPPPPEIHTAESAEAEAAKAKAKADVEAAYKQEKWLYLQKHVETIAKDPLRAGRKTGWDTIPLMHIPRIIAAISNPPAPPQAVEVAVAGAAGAEGPEAPGTVCRRPQSLQRFKRVVEQSNMAMQLLTRVNEVLEKGKASSDAADSGATAARAGQATVAAAQQQQLEQQQQEQLQLQQQQQMQMQQQAAYQQAYQAGLQQSSAYAAYYQYGAQSGHMGMPAPGAMPGMPYYPPGYQPAGFAAPPGLVATMVQKKVGNKVVYIPAYTTASPPGPSSPAAAK